MDANYGVRTEPQAVPVWSWTYVQEYSDPSNWHFKNKLYFAADDCVHGRELWRLHLNGTGLDVGLYRDVKPGPWISPHNFGVLHKGDGTTITLGSIEPFCRTTVYSFTKN